MPTPTSKFTCIQCCFRLRISKPLPQRTFHTSSPRFDPKPLSIRHIRQNPTLYEKNCIERNYKAQSAHPARIISLFEELAAEQEKARPLREQSNLVRRQLANPNSIHIEDNKDVASIKALARDELLDEGRKLKDQLSEIEAKEASLNAEIYSLAAEIPNLTSDETPRGDTPKGVGWFNAPDDTLAPPRKSRPHVELGSELSLLDFTAAATSSGWGWYYLLNEAALLEQALIQYALTTAMEQGWKIVSPPSIVYTQIANACGFQPRDQNGEQQIYNIAQSAHDAAKPQLSLAATAEIPLAAMKAKSHMEASELPIKTVAVSRCYRAEAGARGLDTKGLYRVHEFSKVEMFAWTLPTNEAATAVFDEMLSIQTSILKSLDLHCRILEMPASDLGASATRKRDIEAFFPSRRREKNQGFGEVTSASICTDYQTRRLSTRVRFADRLPMDYPYTVNGTALAVPRVLAAIMEQGWDEKEQVIRIPKVLWPWMGGIEVIAAKHRLK